MKKMMAAVLLICGFRALSAQTAVIREVSGKAEIRASGADWIPAAEGQRIENSTIISTGFNGVVLIALGNSILTVRPLTRLTLDAIQNQGLNENVSVNLQTGRVRADVSPPAGGKTDFTVRSPTATASVRGTSFEFDGIGLSVAEGRVRLTGGDGTTVNVSAGHQVVTDPGTGKTPGVAETVKQEMTPDTPAGAESTTNAAPAFAPVGSFNMEIEWQ